MSAEKISNQSKCVEHPDGTKRWYHNNKLHREDGPAVEKLSCGHKEWYHHGKRHRIDGPAIDNPVGWKEFWLFGKRYYSIKLYWAAADILRKLFPNH